MNEQKDRLVELLDEFVAKNNNTTTSALADHILADGWIRKPYKVGQTVYVVSRYYVGDWEVYKCNIDSITIYEKNTFISCVANDVRFGKINFGLNISEIGKTVFLSREEAEAKLKEGVQG